MNKHTPTEPIDASRRDLLLLGASVAAFAVLRQLGWAEAEPYEVNAIQSPASELVAGMVWGDTA
jgi:hypothetical protein